MASYHLGPESPRPFCVGSEDNIRRSGINLPYIPEYERYSFGATYEKKICSLVHKHLELGTDDRLCYCGDSKGSLAPLLQRDFCLIEPITSVLPGHIHYEESPNHKMIPIKVASVGVEDYFRAQSKQQSQFDKVLLKDSVIYLDEPMLCFQNIMKTLTEFGKLLIIHRPAPINTLPIFNDAKTRLIENDKSYESIIKALQDCNLDVNWELECLPIIMPKLKWISMLGEHFPPQLEIVSPFEVRTGLRELSEGVLKYGGEMVEFVDRLLFITASPNRFSQYPIIDRSPTQATNTESSAPKPDDLKYFMKVTPDIQRYVKQKEIREKNSNRKLREA